MRRDSRCALLIGVSVAALLAGCRKEKDSLIVLSVATAVAGGELNCGTVLMCVSGTVLMCVN